MPSLPKTLHAGQCTPSHPLAAILTASFLDFSAAQGTDMRKKGIEAGTRYCMDAKTWKSALDEGIDDLPRVKLECSHQKALDSVGLNVLKKWAAGQDVGGHVVRPGEAGQGLARESKEIGGKEPRA